MHSPPQPRVRSTHLGGLAPGLGLWWYRDKAKGWMRSLFPHRVLCVSEAVRDGLAATFSFPRRKLAPIRSGVDKAIFRPDETRRRESRAAWGVPDSALVFGAVARLSPYKNFETAIAQFARLADELPERDMRLVLVGEGPLREKLEALARDRGCANRVLLPGFTNRPETAYPGFDVFVMPSRGEALGLALLEALSCGCPAIAAGVGGVPEVIGDTHVGWLTAPGDEEGFLAAMREAANCAPAALVAMGRRARDRVTCEFDSRIQFARMAEFLENEIAGAP